MKIIQILPNICAGDAVSDDCLAIDEIIGNIGCDTEIYAETIIGDRAKLKAKHITKLPKIKEDDILIYHCSIGWKHSSIIKNAPCYKIMRYHNITPPKFFESYHKELYQLTTQGYEELYCFKDIINRCIADSQYNKENLIGMGYLCDIDVITVIVPFKKYDQQANNDIINEYSMVKRDKFLFTGRVAPNKKIEDIIIAFYNYKTYINGNSILFLAGSFSKNDMYYNKLMFIINKLKLEDVHFLGHISFYDLLAYYRLADVYLCMSEHEGFCVPLLEAMYFDIPIIAYNSTAIPYTLGQSGIILKKKDYNLIAEVMYQIVSNKNLKDNLILRQKMRLKEFDYEVISKKFESLMIDLVSNTSRKGGTSI